MDDHPITEQLTVTEWTLLLYLWENPCRLVSYEEILREALKTTLDDRKRLDSPLYRLRDKLDSQNRDRFIITRSGQGLLLRRRLDDCN